ncbi:hypothetical protein NO995_08365 [Aestuariibaculum sp. M13]|uniref:hypothetical protein n=1 Tax=Aestuariibaculum sp. M13 TaxID=2967132 RepID=UPI002159F313|nr:hypothetical protein [Aestuariibaculum sp. M13]MCR8667693.1 hypothetical protein [Aestuariibaculum sp. M13]
MKTKLTFLKTLLIILIGISFNSCNISESGKEPLTIEERTVANYLIPNYPTNDINVRFHSFSIADIPMSYIAVLSDENNFDSYINQNSKREQITIKNIPENLKNRDQKEIIAKMISCKFTLSNNPNDLIEQTFILDKTGQNCIYSDDFMKVTR